jgi:16S rRNA (cytosine967-C5)-methyltransferase
LSDWHYCAVSAEKPRQIAVRILTRHGAGAGWVESLLDEELGKAGGALSPPDRGLVQELVFGIVRWKATLDWLIAKKTQGRTQRATLQILLRLGLYQMFWLDRIPDHAAVHETVEIAKAMGMGPQAGFLNAVLRGCLRERPALEKELEDLKTTSPHLGHSHPQWLCARWEKRWGNEKLRALLEWNNTPPPTFARVNTLKTTPEKLAAQFESEGVLFTPRPFAWVPGDLVMEFRSHPPLGTLPSFQQGLFYVQDPSTLLAVRELNPQPGEKVLDLCAAPGGKTSFMAQLMENDGTVVAQDADVHRRTLIQENCQRLGVACVTLAGPMDSAGHFDRVLVDAPCSNTGVMRRRVELRWRIQPAEITRLHKLQQELLAHAASQLKPGGTLIYSTCSLEPEENEQVVREFLAERRDFQLERERQLLPFVDRVDGAYVAMMRRT